MANIRLNGNSNINNVTCFSFAPTILEVSSNASGSYTTWQLFIGELTSMKSDMWVKVNDVTLNLVTNINDAKGYRFYMTPSSMSTQRKLMANSLMEALKRVPELVAGYDVYMPYTGSEKQLQIMMKSKSYGNNTPLNITTNIPSIGINNIVGSASTELKEGDLKIDIYKMTPAQKYNTASPSTGSYVTTLSKHTSNDAKVKFDLGSVFSSLTEEGEASQFGVYIYQTTNNSLTEIADYKSVYNVNGYLINQGGEFIPRFDNAKIALNAGRGENRNYLNNTILYVYENTIPLSVYAASNVNSISYKIKYIGSDNVEIINVQQTVNVSKALNHFTINLSDGYLAQAKYIDIEFTSYNLGTLRFNVIKPVRATDECQRVYWYNSWGGVSFFDFTGNRTEERKVKTTTYQDSVLDYYDNDTNERDYIYDKQNEITVKLTTHNIHKDGQWHLFDLQQSRTAWTYVNGEKYRIIVSDLTINTTSVTDIYTATIDYTYSMGVNA